jgi:ATP-dependent Lon protease
MDHQRQLSLLPIRGSVLFPGAEMPIYVGRESTIRALGYARDEASGKIAVFTQTRHENPGPLETSELHQVGTICRISASVELKDQTMKVMLEGLERVRMKGFKDENGVSIVTVEPWPEITKPDKKLPENQIQDLLRLLEAWNPAYNSNSELVELTEFRESKDLAQAVRALRVLTAKPRLAGSPEEERIWKDLTWKDPTKIPSDIDQRINNAVSRRVQILEESDFQRAVGLLRDLLEYDIACRARSRVQ